MALLGTPTPGLVPVQTPAGVLMMAPDMAAEVAPYVDPVLGDPAMVASGGTPQTIEQQLEQGPAMSAELDQMAPVTPPSAVADLAVSAPPPQAPAPMAPQRSSAAADLDNLLSNAPGTMSTSSTRRSAVPFSGPRRADYEQAQDANLAAMQKSAQATGALADMQTAFATREASQAEDMVRADQVRRARQDAIVNDARQKRDAAFAKIPDKLDPNRWDKTGGVAQVLGAIGVMLGGISQGITGRENPGKAIIDGVVASDLEQQRAEIELAQQEAGRADNELQDALDLYGDPILAEKQLQLDSYGAVLKELQAYMQGAQGDAAKATVAQAIAEFQAERARIANEMDGRVGEIVTTSQTNPELENRQWETKVKAKENQLAAESDPLHGMNDASKRDALARRVRLPDGTDLWSPSPEHATKLKPLITSHDRYKKNTARIRELMNESGVRNLGWGQLKPEVRGELEALTKTNTVLWRDILQLGALTGADQTLVAPLTIEEVNDLWSRDAATVAKMNAADAFADDLYNGALRDMDTNPRGSSESAPFRNVAPEGWRRTK